MKVGVDSGNLGSPQIVPAPDTTPQLSSSRGIVLGIVFPKFISFTNTTACVIRVTAQKSGYNTKHRDFSVTPAPATFTSIDWAAFPSSGSRGSKQPVPLPTPLQFQWPATTYGIAHQSGGCSWDSVARTISFTDTTTCVIRVTASKTGFTPRTRDFSVTPGNGEDYAQCNWGSYGTVSVGGGVVAAPTLTEPPSTKLQQNPGNQPIPGYAVSMTRRRSDGESMEETVRFA